MAPKDIRFSPTTHGAVHYLPSHINTTPSTSNTGGSSDSKFSPTSSNRTLETTSTPSTSAEQTTPSTSRSSPQTEESAYYSHDELTANEALRQAFQFGRQPRLANFRFLLDETITQDFKVDDWSVPHPVIRVSRSKFDSIFFHNDQMIRKFKEDCKIFIPDTSDKSRNQRLKARIIAATSEVEQYILMNVTRRKAILLNQYRMFNSMLAGAVRIVEEAKKSEEANVNYRS